ncbi:Protein kinase domain, partial [Arabidopsis suecica]
MYYNTLNEYCSGRNLAKHIERNRGKLPEDDVKSFASEILVGLKYLHEEKIIHSDIKPKNILLAFENNRFAKIAGFGKVIKKGSVEYGDGLGHRRGTSWFLSPEVMMGMILDYGADVWAFGCTVLEMLTGERVWSEFAKDFLTKCLERDPAKRWSVDSLLKHEFLKWIDEEEEEDDFYDEIGDVDVEYEANL